MKTARELLAMALTWESRGNAADQDAMQGLHEDVYPVRVAMQGEFDEVRDYLATPEPEPDGWINEFFSNTLQEWVRDGDARWADENPEGVPPARETVAGVHKFRTRHIYLSSPDCTTKSHDDAENTQSPDVDKADSVGNVD